jgi:hypothetical protein
MNAAKFAILLAALTIMLILTFYTAAYILIEIAEATKPINNSMPYIEKLEKEKIAESGRHILLAICFTIILLVEIYIDIMILEEIMKT